MLTSGTLAVKGDLSVEPADSGERKATWNGNVTLSDFAALDRPTASDLARWKSLALEDVDVASAPLRCRSGASALEDYYARVIVYQDGTLNLTRLLTPGAAPEPTPEAKPAALADAGRAVRACAAARSRSARSSSRAATSTSPTSS